MYHAYTPLSQPSSPCLALARKTLNRLLKWSTTGKCQHHPANPFRQTSVNPIRAANPSWLARFRHRSPFCHTRPYPPPPCSPRLGDGASRYSPWPERRRGIHGSRWPAPARPTCLAARRRPASGSSALRPDDASGRSKPPLAARPLTGGQHAPAAAGDDLLQRLFRISRHVEGAVEGGCHRPRQPH